MHKTYVFRIDRNDGSPWVARAFPPARPRAGVEGDAAVLGFLERQDYPAERLAVDDAVSDFDGSAVLVTRFVEGTQLPDGAPKFAMMGELLGRLHALPYDDSVSRPGGASGEDPRREGTPRQDLLAALSFLDAVLTERGPVAINWKASGRGPRLADFAYLIWGTGSWDPRRPNQEWIDAAVNAYRRHIEPTDDELDRLEAVMYIRTLYLACFGYRRALINGSTFNEWSFIKPPEYFSSTAAATRAAFRRSPMRPRNDASSPAPHQMSRGRAPVEVPEDIVEQVRALCLALPEVTVRIDGWAQSFDIRRRSFCLLVAREGPAGKPVPLLVLRAGPDEREALLSIGRPFFAPRAGRDRIGVLLTDDTDWEEIRELVTESYRVLAPKKLIALLDSRRRSGC